MRCTGLTRAARSTALGSAETELACAERITAPSRARRRTATGPCRASAPGGAAAAAADQKCAGGKSECEARESGSVQDPEYLAGLRRALRETDGSSWRAHRAFGVGPITAPAPAGGTFGHTPRESVLRSRGPAKPRSRIMGNGHEPCLTVETSEVWRHEKNARWTQLAFRFPVFER